MRGCVLLAKALLGSVGIKQTLGSQQLVITFGTGDAAAHAQLNGCLPPMTVPMNRKKPFCTVASTRSLRTTTAVKMT